MNQQEKFASFNVGVTEMEHRQLVQTDGGMLWLLPIAAAIVVLSAE